MQIKYKLKKSIISQLQLNIIWAYLFSIHSHSLILQFDIKKAWKSSNKYIHTFFFI